MNGYMETKGKVMLKKICLGLMFLFFTANVFAADDLKNAFSEGKVSGQFRTQYFARNYDTGTDREDFATGGMFYYRTAPLKGVNFGVAFYTGQGLGLNNDDKDVYGLLDKKENGDHASFTALGEAYLQGEFGDTMIKAGRQELETPWINGDDNRLTPQSVQGIVLVNKSISDLELFAGHITRMKGKASSEFLSMTEYAEIPDVDKPVTVGSLTFSGIERFKFQLWDYYAHEFLNNLYFRADYNQKVNDDMELSFTFQYLNQTDTGDSVAGSIDTYGSAVEAGIEVGGYKFTAAYAVIGDQDVAYPWGHDWLVSAAMNDSSRADEDDFMLTFSYDFGRIGIPNLKGKIVHADFDTPETGPNASYDYTETDFDLKYKLSGKLEGMSLRARYGIINKDEALGGNDYNDIRLYVRYDF
jgi:hypothetical protein